MTFYRPLRLRPVNNVHYSVLQVRATIIWNFWTWYHDTIPWYLKDNVFTWILMVALITFLGVPALWAISIMVSSS